VAWWQLKIPSLISSVICPVVDVCTISSSRIRGTTRYFIFVKCERIVDRSFISLLLWENLVSDYILWLITCQLRIYSWQTQMCYWVLVVTTTGQYAASQSSCKLWQISIVNFRTWPPKKAGSSGPFQKKKLWTVEHSLVPLSTQLAIHWQYLWQNKLRVCLVCEIW
jgi:hypothetical protein